MSTLYRTWTYGALVALAFAAGGCSEPPPIVLAAAPGEDPLTAIKPPKEEPAEALGETALLKDSKAAPAPNIPLALPTAKGEVKTTQSGVKYETLKEGTGETAKAGQTVSVHYVGTLDDGRKFDSSRDSGKDPASFTLDESKVIKGWVEGVTGMKVGEVRKLIVPPSAGYGAQGKGVVPANATLTFEIELFGAK